MIAQTQKHSKETEILSEIRDAEKKADDILEKAKIESESILREASRNSSRLSINMQEEIIKASEKRILDFREKLKFLKEEKLAEGNEIISELKAKAQKNIPKAVGLVMQKFEEGV